MSLLLDPDRLGSETRTESKKLSDQFHYLSSRPKPEEKRNWASSLKVSGLSVAALAVLMIGAEHIAPAGWKPSTFIGAFGGKVQTVEILESIDAVRALTAVQEQERARGMQEVEQLRAAQERLTLAYRVEFERGNELIRAGANAAQQLLASVIDAKMRGMDGGLRGAAIKDSFGIWCDFGNIAFQTPDCGPQLRASARADRDAIQAELIESWISAQERIVGIAQSWAAGLLSPQDLIAEMQQNTPHLYAAPREPIPPNPYRTP